MERGFVHIYTGDGKGKTTAAFGLAVRALCAGRRVFIGQFVKSMKYNETKVERLFPGLRIEQFGRGCFIGRNPAEEDAAAARAGLDRCREAEASGLYDVVILDEITIAVHFGLLSAADVAGFLRGRRAETEIVLTGRYAPRELIEAADLVTDMREVKHYYAQGVLSRDGIDR